MVPGPIPRGLEDGAVGAQRSEGNPGLVMVCAPVVGICQRTTDNDFWPSCYTPLFGNTGGRALPSRPERQPDLSDSGSFHTLFWKLYCLLCVKA